MDFNLTISDVKSEPTGLVKLIPKLQPCYQHSHEIEHKNAEKCVVLKEEERRTSTTEIKFETGGAETGNTRNDVKIQLKFCGDRDLLNSCSNNKPVEQEIDLRVGNSTVHVDSCVPMNMADTKICRVDSTSNFHKYMHTHKRNYKCDICRKLFTRTSSVTRHMKTHGHEKNHKCETCNKYFTFKADLSHIKSHANDEKYKCEICSRRFKIQRNMQQHMEVKHNGETYKCEICAKSFTKKRYMSEHTKLHTNEKRYECQICSKSIKTKRGMSEHVKIHTGDKNFKCDVCNKRFKRKPSLSEHAKINVRRDFECDVCRKCFTPRCILCKVHADDRNHPCEICEKRFKTRRGAVEHVKIHSDEKNYQCKICTKRFKTKECMSEHSEIHTKERNHKCDVCGKRFETKRYLLDHVERHSSERNYKCEICNQRFRRRKMLVEHNKTHIGEYKEEETLKKFLCNVQRVGEFGSQSIKEEINASVKEEKFEIDNDTIERKLSMALNESDTDTVVIDEKPKSTDIFELWQSLNDAIVIKEEENFDE